MLEYASGLCKKVYIVQNKFWETHENSICYTEIN